MNNQESVAEQDFALMKLILEKTKEGKISWAFQSNSAIGTAANLTIAVTVPSSDFLQNTSWRSVQVAVPPQGLITSFFFPADQTAVSQGGRFASIETAELVNELLGALFGLFTKKTYGKAISTLQGL
jgi:hypothetical protein